MHPAIVKAVETGGNLDAAIVEAATPMREAIERLLRQDPFVPFRIHMTGKHTCEVRRPECVRLSSSVARIGEPDPSEPDGFRWRSMLALIHVVSLEPLVADEPALVCPTGPKGERS